MRNLNAERAGMDVHLSSPAPVSVPPGYHKILGAVKRNAPTAISWGRSASGGTMELTGGNGAQRNCRPVERRD